MSNDILYKASVMKMIDLEESPNNPKSFSGGRATHDLQEVTSHSYSTLKELVNELTHMYGQPFDQIDNRLFFSIDQDSWNCSACPETYDVYIEEIIQRDVSYSEIHVTVENVTGVVK